VGDASAGVHLVQAELRGCQSKFAAKARAYLCLVAGGKHVGHGGKQLREGEEIDLEELSVIGQPTVPFQRVRLAALPGI
jgi:hypothetical protein